MANVREPIRLSMYVTDLEHAEWRWETALHEIGFTVSSGYTTAGDFEAGEVRFRRRAMRPVVLTLSWSKQTHRYAHHATRNCLFAPSPEAVAAFYDAALRRGGSSTMPPQVTRDCYVTTVQDYDGNQIQAVYDPRVRLFPEPQYPLARQRPGLVRGRPYLPRQDELVQAPRWEVEGRGRRWELAPSDDEASGRGQSHEGEHGARFRDSRMGRFVRGFVHGLVDHLLNRLEERAQHS